MRIGFVFRNLRSRNNPDGAVPRFLESRGFEPVVADDGVIREGWADVVWLQGSMNWYPRARESLLAIPRATRPKTIFWHTEPLPLPKSCGVREPLPTLAEVAKMLLNDSRATDVRSNARRVAQMCKRGFPDVLAVSTSARQAYLAERGIKSHFVPAGCSPRLGSDLGLERDVEALFVGIMSDPRHAKAVGYLRRSGIDVTARGDWSKKEGLWGDERTRTINRAKTFLALQRHPGELSGVRMLLGMANRALVISEPIFQPEPYIPGVHYVSVPLRDMPDAIRYYNRNEEEAKRIADAGHRFATTELTFERSMTKILEIAGLA